MDATNKHPASCDCGDCVERALGEPEAPTAGDHRCAPQGPTWEVLRARRGVTHRDIAEGEAELVRRYQAGDKHAGEILLLAHAKLISYYGAKYSKGLKHDLTPEDVLTLAQVGFLEAARRFEPERGYKLVTYGQRWIRSAVKAGTIDTGKTIYVPAYHYDKRARAKARYAKEALAATKMASLDAPVDADSDLTLGDLLEDGKPLADEQLVGERDARSLDGLVDRAGLSEIEQAIVKRRIFTDEEETLEQIGDSFGLSRERIRQLQGTAISKLRRAYANGRSPSPVATTPPSKPIACQRCGHEGHRTKTCERWAGKTLGSWVVERVGAAHYSASGTMTTMLVLRCTRCKKEETTRAIYFGQKRVEPCTCARTKPPVKRHARRLARRLWGGDEGHRSA